MGEQSSLVSAFEEALAGLDLASEKISLLDDLYLPISKWIQGQAAQSSSPFILGVNGAQGSGKSTFCALLSQVLERGFGLRVVVLSIDDLYRTHAARQRFADELHPLCAIRGVPGTHELQLGHEIFDALSAATDESETRIPRFDKAQDDRVDDSEWDLFQGRPDVIFFEGWCVGAQPGPAWDGPINSRETRDDPKGDWYRWSNASLQGEYTALFARLDALLMIQVPSFETVRKSRSLQEEKLRERLRAEGRDDAPGLMNHSEVLDYVALFERQTEQMLRELPSRADVLIERDDDFKFMLKTPL